MAKLNGVKTIDMVNGEITKVEYNGEHYVKVDGPAQVGDLARTVGSYYVDTTQGGFYYIFDSSNSGSYVKFIDDEGDTQTRRSNSSYFVIFRKQSALTPPSVNLTDRVASLETKQDELSSRVDSLEGKAETIMHNGATYTLVDRKAQPGDVVIIGESGESFFFDSGKPYEVINEQIDGSIAAIGNDGTAYGLYVRTWNRTPANVKVYAPVAPISAKQVEPLKVGDYAKVVGDNYYTSGSKGHGLVNGTIIKIEVVDKSGHRQKYEGKTLNSTEMDYFVESDLVKATDEEVAQAKPKLQNGRQSDASLMSSKKAILFV